MSTKPRNIESQSSSCVVMVRPQGFQANTQTLASNAFQSAAITGAHESQRAAAAAFDAAHSALAQAGIEILVLDDQNDPPTPDAVFPNNWFSTHADGRCFWYPMQAQNRRWERRPYGLKRLLKNAGFAIDHVVDISALEHQREFLEGTGALVLDRQHKQAYMARSSRAHPVAAKKFAQLSGYTVAAFDAVDANQKPIYHTNVMMSIGRHFAVVCSDSIANSDERASVLGALSASGRDLIEISFAELNGFAGNILELRRGNGDAVIALSEQAQESMSAGNRAALKGFGELVCADLEAIESVAGGSFRCMLAEIFLPRQ